jgi:hypothetical protein
MIAIETAPITGTPTPRVFSLKEIVNLLRRRDSRTRDFAVATLVHAGRRILPHLVAHASDPRKSASHRIRILKVIARIGYPHTFSERSAIYRLTYADNAPPLVRKAAARLIRVCLYDTSGDHPKGWRTI